MYCSMHIYNFQDVEQLSPYLCIGSLIRLKVGKQENAAGQIFGVEILRACIISDYLLCRLALWVYPGYGIFREFSLIF